MKNTEFRKMLFKAAFCAMACDGEVVDSEIAEIKELLDNSPYFDGLDRDTELKAAATEIKEIGIKTIENFLLQLQNADLSERQELQLLEVLIRIIQSDGNIDNNELVFMENIKKRISKLTNDKIMLNFPRYLDLLFNLENLVSQPIQLNFDKLNDL